jgi:ferrous-iron efflux pump FieF
MDAIGSIIIAGCIFSVAYVSLKQSSLILIDSWQNPNVTQLVRQIVEDNFKKKDQIRVGSILLPAGMRIIFADIHIEVDGNRKLVDVELSRQVETVIRSKIPYIKKISVIPRCRHPLKEIPKRKSLLWCDFILYG